MFLKRILIVARIVLVFSVLIFFSVIANSHVPLTGVKRIEYVFDRPHGSIGVMRPPVRYRVEMNNGQSAARIMEDPVYFDIRTALPYERMEFLVRYRNESPYPFRVAARSSREGWSFDSYEFETHSDGAWTVGRTTIDLATVVRHNGKYTFALSIPGLVLETSNGASVIVRSLSINLYRDPLFQWLRRLSH